MRAWGAVALLGLALAGCMTAPTGPTAPTCPAGQERMRTAQLFFGRDVAGRPAVSETEFRRFVDEELTPRFPDGLTVLDADGQWRGADSKLIREASKVVLIVLPPKRGVADRIEAVRTAYRARFHQNSVLVITQAACVSF